MLRNPADNTKETNATIARRILASPLAQFVGHACDAHRLDALEALVMGDKDVSAIFSDIACTEFRRAGTSVTLDVRRRSEETLSGKLVHTDSEGNEWKKYSITFGVNWPCHGTVTPSVALARVALYHEVAMLAAMLEAEFGNGYEMWQLHRSAEEVSAAKREEEALNVKMTAGKFVDANCRGLRVGFRASRLLIAKPEGLPKGTYTHTRMYGNVAKTFQLEVTEWHARVIRTS